MMSTDARVCDAVGMKRQTSLLIVAMTAACVPVDDGAPVVVQEALQQQASAVDGAWQPEQALLDEAAGYDFAFDNAPNYDGGDGCSDGPTAGALQLRDALRDTFPQVDDVGIYNCRVIGGTNSMSLHGVGRALDIMLPPDDGDADNGLGDEIAHWLIERAPDLGLQTVIWDHSIWRIGRNPQFGAYGGENPHVDHIHAEINLEASQQQLPWYGQPSGPVPCDNLVINNTPVVIDTDDACFAAFGPASGWRTETGVGEGGSLLWTNAFNGAAPVNSARWSLPVAGAVTVEIEVAIDDTFGVYTAAEYRIDDGEQIHVAVVDQSAASGWTSLGVHTLLHEQASVTVVDNHAGAVPAQSHIVVDALRITPATLEPPVDEPPPDPVDPSEGESNEGEGDTSEGEGEPPPDDDPGPVDDDDPGTVTTPVVIITQQSAQGCAQMGTSSLLAMVVLLWRRRRA
jgi:hypothetical protein